MKKIYTKPVIEGELFEVNEAVAACYYVQAADGSSWYVYDEPTGNDTFLGALLAPTADDIKDDGFFQGWPSGEWYYSADRNPLAIEFLVGEGEKHRVSVKITEAGGAHPNASV